MPDPSSTFSHAISVFGQLWSETFFEDRTKTGKKQNLAEKYSSEEQNGNQSGVLTSGQSRPKLEAPPASFGGIYVQLRQWNIGNDVNFGCFAVSSRSETMK